MRPAMVIHYHEIALKGGNRDWFERTLIENIRWALHDVAGAEVRRMSGRVVIRPSHHAGPGDAGILDGAIVDRLQKVFGIASILVGCEVRQEYSGLEEDVMQFCQERHGALRHGESKTFAVRVKRGNKQYPKNSQQLERDLGAAIMHATGWTVNLEQPDVTVYVEIVERTAFVFTEKYPGPGGLPVGVSGRVVALLSSGFDSPVAAWRMMKRGCIVDFVHFHSYPYTSDASQRNVEAIVRVLQEWQQGRGRLYAVPLIEYQKSVMTGAPAALRVLLYRRMMYRIAERIARACGAGALVTGESVGQVASQTVANLSAVGVVVQLPMFRPLIGQDKQEIIAHAEHIGTATISQLPYDDCCSLFTPDHPATHATATELDAEERRLGIDQWIEKLVVSVVR